jgi:hypothetical protein
MLLDLLDMGGIQKLTEQIRIDMNQARRENLRLKQLTPEDIMMNNQQKVMEAQQGTNEQAPDGAPLYVPDANGNFDPASFPPMVEVHDYDNHDVHIKTHNNYRKSGEFETLDDSIKQEFDKHIRLHQAHLQMQAQQQMMMGMPPPGMEGGAPPEEPGMPGADPMQEGEPGMPAEGGM